MTYLLRLTLMLAMAWPALHAALPKRARHAMVVSGETNATAAGVRVLQSGGNAADAAVAMAFTLSVTHSAMCGLGGGGHALVRTAGGEVAFFDFRERAPAAASRAMFLDSRGNLSPDSVIGWKAAAVPGSVKGLAAIHRRFGTKPWAGLLEPAIRLASGGHAVTFQRAEMFRASSTLPRDPESTRIFLNGGRHYQPGDILTQPDLARTLERIASEGEKEFYEGETARRLAAAIRGHGGLLTETDLKTFTVSEGRPLAGRYRNCEVLTAAGSSSGGVGLLQMLGILEGTAFVQQGANSAGAIHFQAEAMRRAFADRSGNIGDPEFVRVPYAKLLDPAHLAEMRASIRPGRATPSAQVRPGKWTGREGGDTTHFAIVDAAGNAVAVTFTLNSAYGAGVTVPGLGFLLNNNMDNFAANPGKTNQYGLVQGEANAIQPGKRPVSSMTPTMLLKDGRLFMVAGTPGGPTIANSVLQAIVNVVDFGMNAQDAVSAPRVHHQWQPDRLYMEPGFSPDTIALLRAMGHEIEIKPSNNDFNMILFDGAYWQGAVDPRREGSAAGY